MHEECPSVSDEKHAYIKNESSNEEDPSSSENVDYETNNNANEEKTDCVEVSNIPTDEEDEKGKFCTSRNAFLIVS